MGIKKVTSARIAVNLHEDTRKTVDPPEIIVYHPGRAIWKLLALKLVGVTALTGNESLRAVQEAAAAIDESDERDWSHTDALTILDAVGAIPSPSHIIVERVKGGGTAAGAPAGGHQHPEGHGHGGAGQAGAG